MKKVKDKLDAILQEEFTRGYAAGLELAKTLLRPQKTMLEMRYGDFTDEEWTLVMAILLDKITAINVNLKYIQIEEE